MPYEAIKSGDQWKVVKQDDHTKVLGTHDTKGEADAQLAALYANEPSARSASNPEGINQYTVHGASGEKVSEHSTLAKAQAAAQKHANENGRAVVVHTKTDKEVSEHFADMVGYLNTGHMKGAENFRSLTLVGSTGKPRLGTLEGREHLIVPVVMLMEGVIHAVNASTPELVPLSTLQAAAQSWNGRPVTLGHPVKDGRQCSANEPEIINSKKLGTMLNVRVEGKKLLGDAYIDVNSAKRLLSADHYNDLAKGTPIEVSVGAVVATNGVEGEVNGKAYKDTWVRAAGDHLAFLPGGRGACSIEMGCGTCRAASAYQIAGEELVEASMNDEERIERYLGLDQKQRDKIPAADFAGKNQSYYIEKPSDVYDAAASIGRAGPDNYDTATLKANIIKIAKRKGPEFVAQLPKAWRDDMKAASAKPLKRRSAGFGVGDTVKVAKDGDKADGKTGKVTAASKGGTVLTVGDLGMFHQSDLRAAAEGDDTEEAAEAIAYASMQTMLESASAAIAEAADHVKTLVDDESLSDDEEDAHTDAIRASCMSAIGSLSAVASSCYDQQNDGGPAAMGRYMEAFRAAIGKRNSAADAQTIQNMHDMTQSLGASCDPSNASYRGMQAGGDKPGFRAACGCDTGAACSCKGEGAMDKEQRAEVIAALVANPHSGFKDDDVRMLAAASDERLEAFRAATDARKVEADAKAKAETDARDAGAKVKVLEGKVKALEATPTEEEWLKRAPDSVKDMFAERRAAEDARREELVGKLKTLGHSTEEELKAMSMKELERLAAFAKVDQPVRNFSAKGLPNENRAAGSKEKEVSYAPPDPYKAAIETMKAAEAVATARR